MAINELRPFAHQEKILAAPIYYRDINDFFLIAGYGSGKTYSLVWMILALSSMYDETITCGLFGPTMTFMEKNLLNELFVFCMLNKIPYKYNSQKAVLLIGNAIFYVIATSIPKLIYGYTLQIALVDEHDELPQEVAIEAYTAIKERTRKPLPDGRAPYTVFATTAQGYKGIYAIVEELKRKKRPFYLLRAKTRDNPFNDKSYVENLEAIYNENERLAFLEGMFVNLTTGRVYPGYDPAKNDLHGAFPLEPNETVHVGQDLNSGFSKGVAYVIRDGKAYAVKAFSFPVIGNAPQIIRAAFPVNRIIWYPDASGKEIMAGYTAEMRNSKIELRIGTINPPIIERIFFVNKLCELDRMFICDDAEPLRIALKVRQFDETGKPTKGKGEAAPDHICDSNEYVIWRIVSSLPEFFDLFRVSRNQEAV
jgi:hypothetical protein